MAADRDTLIQYIAEAKEALHALALGDKVSTISNIDGGSTTYTLTSIKQLKSYIRDLEDELGRIDNSKRRAPIEFAY